MPEPQALESRRGFAVASIALIVTLVSGIGLAVSGPSESAFGYAWLVLLLLAVGVAWLAMRAELPGVMFESSASSSARPTRKESVEAKFLAAMGHDLRQPVQAISLFSATLATHPLPDESSKLVRGIESAVEVLSRQLEAVFSIAKIEAGRTTYAPQSFALEPILAGVVSAHIDDAHGNGLHVRHVTTGVQVASDPVHVAKILDCLVLHAMAVTKSGGVVIGARHRRGGVAIEVWDSSPGADAELLKGAFEIDSAYAKNLPDRALGLILAHRLAGLIGATLKFDSRPGKGNALRLELPVVK